MWNWDHKIQSLKPLQPSGSPFDGPSRHGDLFQFLGSHFFFNVPIFFISGLRMHEMSMQPPSYVDRLITCDNTTNTNESQATLSVKLVLFQNNFPPSFKCIISTNQLHSVNYANMCFLGPHSAGKGPQFTKNWVSLGPHFGSDSAEIHNSTISKILLQRSGNFLQSSTQQSQSS